MTLTHCDSRVFLVELRADRAQVLINLAEAELSGPVQLIQRSRRRVRLYHRDAHDNTHDAN